ncbi:unnamed protein product [Hymenolepis diminuta]|uniref:Myotubularin phosphatase domain-containing protein n=1 Tax=Hymenolepis diminuta TaxID=6216 RepID=A0A0R3SLS0_HYMDI|nr:unnamed protein product [Hymenolepis diminuta]
MFLLSEFLTLGSASEIQRLAKGSSLYHYDAGRKHNVPDFPSWRHLGSTENYDIVAIPRVETGEEESVVKKGAYLDLPWG